MEGLLAGEKEKIEVAEKRFRIATKLESNYCNRSNSFIQGRVLRIYKNLEDIAGIQAIFGRAGMRCAVKYITTRSTGNYFSLALAHTEDVLPEVSLATARSNGSAE
jgi:hypothetical protein